MHVETTTLSKEKWSKKTLKLQTKIDELKNIYQTSLLMKTYIIGKTLTLT